MMWPGTARLPRPRWGLAMTRQGGAAVHQRSDTVQLACARRSLSAATDAIGRFVFTGSRYESAVPPRDCRIGRRPPRNDKPLAFTVLSPACSERQHCAGPGCPLPYRVCTVGESAQKFAADNGSAIAALFIPQTQKITFALRQRLFLVRRKGLEPPTYWFVASHSIQLSYRRVRTQRAPIYYHNAPQIASTFFENREKFSAAPLVLDKPRQNPVR